MISDDLMFVPAALFTRRYQSLFTKKARVSVPVGWVEPICKFLTYCEIAEIEHKVRRIEMKDDGSLATEFDASSEDIDSEMMMAMILAEERCHNRCIHDGTEGKVLHSDKGSHVVCIRCMLEDY